MLSKHLSISVAILSLIIATRPGEASENPPWADRLKADLVRVEGGMFKYEDLALCAVNASGQSKRNVQIRSRAEAPGKAVLSRDQFVALVTQYETILILGLTAVSQGSLSCRPLDEVIGVPDLEISIVMTKNGLQYEATVPATGKVDRSVMTWAEVFPE